jgi:hypothetical protein
MVYSPNQERDNHGRFGSNDTPILGKQPLVGAPQQPQKPVATPEEIAAAQEQAKKLAGEYQPLEGLPQKPITLPNGKVYVPGPIAALKNAATEYMKQAGLDYSPPTDYVKVDVARAQRIAQAFDEEKHAPDDPAVKASYEAMAKETLAQWEVLKKTGLKVEWVKPGQKDPYAASPRLAAVDVGEKNHWWGFPTDQGFGSGPEAVAYRKNNPLLRETGEVIDGRKVVVNDVFRIVHDMMGHLKEGNGFRAEGEENAWRSHAAMYSDLARSAMTNETRGQNSWVNYGPYGAENRTASAENTHFAPQKIGLLPKWVEEEGRTK